MTNVTEPAGRPGGGPPMGPPPAALANTDTVYGMFRARMLCTAAELGIADQLASGPKTAPELAAATATHLRSLQRLMRPLIADGVFTEDGQGYALNDRAKMLLTGVPFSQNPMLRFFGSGAVWAAWGALTESIRTGNNAFEAVHQQRLFDFMAANPADGAAFNQFMSSLPLFMGALRHDYSTAKVVVDVGGGQANAMVPLLRSNPNLRGIVMDMESVVAGARDALLRAGLDERCDVIAGDFFDSVPAGGDVYLLSNILHDWDDEHCAKILRNVRAAMQPGRTLVVVEAIVPPGPEPHQAKLIDMQMLVVLGGLQRTEAEFRELLAASGFEVVRVLVDGMANMIAAEAR